MYWMNSGLVRKYHKTKPKKDKPVLKSNSLLDQLSLHNNLKSVDDQLCHYFIHGGGENEID